MKDGYDQAVQKHQESSKAAADRHCGESTLSVADNRAAAVVQRKLQQDIHDSSTFVAQGALAEGVAQREPEEEELLQGKFIAQLQELDEEELLQGKMNERQPTKRHRP